MKSEMPSTFSSSGWSLANDVRGADLALREGLEIDLNAPGVEGGVGRRRSPMKEERLSDTPGPSE